MVTHAANGVLISESYYAYGVQFRADGPAQVRYHPETGVPVRETYRTGAVAHVHRTDGPAEIDYYPNGTVKTELWVEKSMRSRWLGPSEINYAPDGSVEGLFYTANGSTPCSLEHLTRRLRALPEEELREKIEASSYGHLLTEHEPQRIVDAVAEGLITEEGVRLYLEGTPAEWVRSYESAGASG